MITSRDITALYYRGFFTTLPGLAAVFFGKMVIKPQLHSLSAEVDQHYAETPLATLTTIFDFATNYFWPILAAIIIAIALLEWKSTAWQKHRSLGISIITVAVNTLTAATMFLMATLAIIFTKLG